MSLADAFPAVSQVRFPLGGVLARFRVPSSPLPLWRRRPSLRRVLVGGRLADAGRLPRYALLTALGLAGIWAPILGYLTSAPPRFTSHMSLILPGSGASSSVNLARIGQASTHANSAFASSAVSPTETYKRLLSADRVLRDAAKRLGTLPRDFGKPQVQLVDQTAFIHIRMSGPDAEGARARNAALLAAFMAEIDRLRSDEQDTRQNGGLEAIHAYRASVAKTRAELDQLRDSTGLHSVDQFDRQIDEADALQLRIDRLAAELERQQAAVRDLEARLGLDAATAALVLRVNGDGPYLALVAAVAEAEGRLADATARFGTRHPDVEAARAARTTAQTRAMERALALTGRQVPLERTPDGGRGALLAELVQQDADRAGTASQLRTLRAQHMTQTQRLARLAPLAARLEDLQRDFDVAEAVFASAIARTQSSRTNVYASYPLVQVLEDPTLPERPTSPRRKLAVLAGIAATILLGIALGLGWVRKAVLSRLVAAPVDAMVPDAASPRENHTSK